MFQRKKHPVTPKIIPSPAQLRSPVSSYSPVDEIVVPQSALVITVAANTEELLIKNKTIKITNRLTELFFLTITTNN